jgi:biotin operon repressor
MGRRKTGLSERQIARALRLSRTVVTKTIRAFQVSSLQYVQLE